LRRANLSEANLRWANLSEANLSEANLIGADLSEANLIGADLDYSCWPLSCRSLGVKADKRLISQLAYHLLDLAKSSGIEIGDLKELANSSHVVTEHGKPKFE
jgi:hypothetical protein